MRRVRLSASGVSDSPLPDCLALRRSLEAGVRPAFPPSLVVQVKALACELPYTLGLDDEDGSIPVGFNPIPCYPSRKESAYENPTAVQHYSASRHGRGRGEQNQVGGLCLR